MIFPRRLDQVEESCLSGVSYNHKLGEHTNAADGNPEQAAEKQEKVKYALIIVRVSTAQAE